MLTALVGLGNRFNSFRSLEKPSKSLAPLILDDARRGGRLKA